VLVLFSLFVGVSGSSLDDVMGQLQQAQSPQQ